MIKNVDPYTKRVKKHITHQNIGGKEILIEKEMTLYDVQEQSTIAAFQFFDRRMDLATIGIFSEQDVEDILEGLTTKEELEKYYDRVLDSYKVYYGHVGNLGYFVTEDELEDIK